MGVLDPLNPFGKSGSGKDIIIAYKDKTVVGLTEHVTAKSPKGERKVLARIDTGATKSSIDVRLAADLKLGPIIKAKLVKSASGSSLRPVVKATIIIANKEITSEFTLADRSHMKYKMLIGQNTLIDNGFIVDPAQKAELKK